MATYMAVNHVGKFRRGQLYTTEQLGVLGRMAVASGHLVPHAETARPKKAAPPRRKKGLIVDGEAAIQAGSGPDLRDDSGT